jgi:hypothetical protein
VGGIAWSHRARGEPLWAVMLSAFDPRLTAVNEPHEPLTPQSPPAEPDRFCFRVKAKAAASPAINTNEAVPLAGARKSDA